MDIAIVTDLAWQRAESPPAREKSYHSRRWS
jgi:hypothetical protein